MLSAAENSFGRSWSFRNAREVVEEGFRLESSSVLKCQRREIRRCLLSIVMVLHHRPVDVAVEAAHVLLGGGQQPGDHVLVVGLHTRREL